MTQSGILQLEVPGDLQRFDLPRAVPRRLHELLGDVAEMTWSRDARHRWCASTLAPLV